MKESGTGVRRATTTHRLLLARQGHGVCPSITPASPSVRCARPARPPAEIRLVDTGFGTSSFQDTVRIRLMFRVAHPACFTGVRFYSYLLSMKVTIDIPETLYRKVKAKSALLGASVRETTTDLYQQWLGETPSADEHASPEAWLASWLAEADAAAQSAPGDPTARQILDEDRSRLERP